MNQISDVNILICETDSVFFDSAQEVFLNIGFEKIFQARTCDQAEQTLHHRTINIALIASEFDGTCGFTIGQDILKKNPKTILFYIIDINKKMDPVKSYLYGGTGFIFRNNQKELFEKISIWSKIIHNVLRIKACINE